MYRKSFTLTDAHIRERFPIFILFLECPDTECDITHDPMKSFIQFKNLSGPLSSLRWGITQSTYGREGLPPEIQLQYYGDVKGYWIENSATKKPNEPQESSSSPSSPDEADDEKEDNNNNNNEEEEGREPFEEKNKDNARTCEDKEEEDRMNPPEKKRRRAFSMFKSSSGPLFAERVKEYLMSPVYSQSGYSSDPSDSTSSSTSIPLDYNPKFTQNPNPNSVITVLVHSCPYKRSSSNPIQLPKPIHKENNPNKKDNPTNTINENDISNDNNTCPEILSFTAIPTAPHTLSKSDLIGIRVLSQVDLKYILAATTSGRVYAFDQHAVHERIRLERLEDVVLGRGGAPRGLGQKLGSWRWEVSEEDWSRVSKYLPRLVAWGFDAAAERTAAGRPVVVCYRVPVVVQTALGLEDVVEFVRALEEACGAESIVPPAVRRLLALRACRSAIKFGTGLSMEECEELMRLLGECRTPFQCAQ